LGKSIVFCFYIHVEHLFKGICTGQGSENIYLDKKGQKIKLEGLIINAY